MTAPPQKQITLNCANKRRYPDELSARAAAMGILTKIREEYEAKSDEEKRRHMMRRTLYVYDCPLCYGWHFSKSGKAWRRVTESDPYGKEQRGIGTQDSGSDQHGVQEKK